MLVGRGDSIRLVPMENAQAAHHARDPDAFPRSPRTAFSFDPRAWLALLREVDAAGEQVLAIAHSHPDGVAHLSAEDRRWAAPDGQPLLPGIAHLVIAFRRGAAPSRGLGACGPAVTSWSWSVRSRAQPEQIRSLTWRLSTASRPVRIVRAADFVYTLSLRSA